MQSLPRMGVIHSQVNYRLVHGPQSRLAFHPGVLVTPPTNGIVSISVELYKLVVPDADALMPLNGPSVSHWKQIILLNVMYTNTNFQDLLNFNFSSDLVTFIESISLLSAS